MRQVRCGMSMIFSVENRIIWSFLYFLLYFDSVRGHQRAQHDKTYRVYCAEMLLRVLSCYILDVFGVFCFIDVYGVLFLCWLSEYFHANFHIHTRMQPYITTRQGSNHLIANIWGSLIYRKSKRKYSKLKFYCVKWGSSEEYHFETLCFILINTTRTYLLYIRMQSIYILMQIRAYTLPSINFFASNIQH